jgi:uncharacterized membrane protein YdjX (TVP38/TMEM64 family)
MVQPFYILRRGSMEHKRQKIRWAIIGTAVTVFIIGPFLVFGGQMEAWLMAFVYSARAHPGTSAFVLGGLLAGDIFLPVPSSIVSTTCGVVHGFIGGALVSALGMTVSCVAGYYAAKAMGRPLVARFVGARELSRLHQLEERYGDWIIIVARPIPVLAEASILFLGLGAMSFTRFIVLVTVSNLGISLVYAAAGAWSAGIQSFLPALAASIVLPWIVIKLGSVGRTPETET